MISSNKLKKNWGERQRRDAWDWLITTRRPNLNLVFSCCVCKIGSTYFVALENAPTATWIQCQTQLGFSFSGNAVFGFVWNGTGPKIRCRKQDVAKKSVFFCEKRLWHIFRTQAPHQKDWKLSFWKCFLIFVPVWTRETTSTKNKLWQQRWTEESVNIVFSDQKWFFFLQK